jgi:hypothetical protein
MSVASARSASASVTVTSTTTSVPPLVTATRSSRWPPAAQSRSRTVSPLDCTSRAAFASAAARSGKNSFMRRSPVRMTPGAGVPPCGHRRRRARPGERTPGGPGSQELSPAGQERWRSQRSGRMCRKGRFRPAARGRAAWLRTVGAVHNDRLEGGARLAPRGSAVRDPGREGARKVKVRIIPNGWRLRGSGHAAPQGVCRRTRADSPALPSR